MMPESGLKELMVAQPSMEGDARRICESLRTHRKTASYVVGGRGDQEPVSVELDLRNQIFSSNLTVCARIGSSFLGVRVFPIWHLRRVCQHRQGAELWLPSIDVNVERMAFSNQP